MKLLQGLAFVFVAEKGASRLKTEVNIWVTVAIGCRQVKEHQLGATMHQCLGMRSDVNITTGDSVAAQAMTTTSLSLTFHTYSALFQ